MFYRPQMLDNQLVSRHDLPHLATILELSLAMKSKGPQFVRYFAPVIEALKELGGSGRPAEVRDVIAQRLKISEQERSVVNKSGASRFENRVHWARFYLAKAGYLDSSTRGVWSLTEKGQAVTKMTHDEALVLFNTLHSQFAAGRSTTSNGASTTVQAEADENIAPSPTLTSTDNSYRTQLLELLQSLPPAGFERLCQRLLREAGFEQVVVTGRSGV